MGIEPLHVGFTVADVQALTAFMRDCLGFEVTEPRRPPAASIEEVTGVIGADVELVYVSAPGLTMELLQYSSPPSATLAGGRPCDLGAAHLALMVPDVADLVRRAAAYGFEPAAPNLPVIAAGPNQGMRATYIRDVSGFTIELMGG
jgi:catechol 2,3-dioxygenase-like lactoylglutathione lyase family enzyme